MIIKKKKIKGTKNNEKINIKNSTNPVQNKNKILINILKKLISFTKKIANIKGAENAKLIGITEIIGNKNNDAIHPIKNIKTPTIFVPLEPNKVQEFFIPYLLSESISKILIRR